MRTLHVFLSVFASSLAFLLLPQNAYAACTLTEAQWGVAGPILPGQTVQLRVEGSGCTGATIQIQIHKGWPFPGEIPGTLAATFAPPGLYTSTTFTLNSGDWERITMPSETTANLYFRARVVNESAYIDSETIVFQKPIPVPTASTSPGPIVTTDKTLGGMIAQVYEWAILLLGAIMFFMIVKSGFTILMNADNPSAVTKARSDIQDVFVGALFLLAAYAILNTINPDLVNFQQNLPPLPTPTPRS